MPPHPSGIPQESGPQVRTHVGDRTAMRIAGRAALAASSPTTPAVIAVPIPSSPLNMLRRSVFRAIVFVIPSNRRSSISHTLTMR